MNSVTLVGRLGQDPKAEVTAKGTSASRLRLAVKRDYSREGQDTDWFDVVCYGQSADFANRYFAKGREIAVKGSVHVDEWQTDAGERRKALRVVADRVEAVGSKVDQPQRDEAAERISEAFGGAEEQKVFDPFAEA